MKRLKDILYAALGVIMLTACGTERQMASNADFVNPYIGTANSETKAAGLFGKGTEEMGQTLPAVLVPHGMNFWTPQTRDTEQKCVAPYYYADSLLQGFRNSHWIVGGCTQDYGSMTLMPLYGKLRTTPEGRATIFDHAEEEVSPYEYTVTLPDEGIQAAMTATSRAAIFRFTYSKAGESYLVVNPNSDEGQGYMEIDLAARQIRGYNPVHRIYQGWGESAGFAGYFVLEWPESLTVTTSGTFKGDDIYAGEDKISNAPGIGAYISFNVGKDETITVKAASSFTGMAGALANLKAEIPGFDYEKTRSDLEDVWRQHLSSIEIGNAQEVDKIKFYSAMYRASFLPHAINDADGSYPAFSKGTPIMKMPEGHDYYEDFSMWDTYRALHPLLNILYPTRSGDMMQSLVLKYEQGGWLPIFPCWNSYTAAMIGDHSIATLADAYIKGVKGFDINKAYEAMRHNAFDTPDNIEDYRNGMGRRALKSYLQYGYIPVEDSVPDAFHKKEQVSRTLEYAFDDFALAQVAEKLGKTSDYDILMSRAENWRNVIDPKTGYATPRKADGSFIPTDPFTFSKHITEGVPCHYTWYVPHDQEGLIEVLGGEKKYAEKLDSMFTQRRHWHGNEPCHQIPWLFSYVDRPEKTAKYVRHIMETEYLDSPGGLSGNDDAGQMSAWYIFAALGFYPVCPASPYYVLGTPLFEHIEINLENGNKFVIEAPGASKDNYEVESIILNGKPLDGFLLSHSDLMNGGTLRFNLK
ncbi:MAG: GH92 family glycosyl hydrolase [Muribaculaceae bacterium]|nr:GH92 family glycosyl hydrolase [Muribaculaceae bacterium]